MGSEPDTYESMSSGDEDNTLTNASTLNSTPTPTTLNRKRRRNDEMGGSTDVSTMSERKLLEESVSCMRILTQRVNLLEKALDEIIGLKEQVHKLQNEVNKN